MKKVKGISLIEILVSLSLIIISVTSFTVSQMQLLQKERDIVYCNQAKWQLTWLLDLLQHNPNPPKSLLNLWRQQIAIMLPDGQGNIIKDKQQQVITITWGNRGQCTKQTKDNDNCLYYAFSQ